MLSFHRLRIALFLRWLLPWLLSVRLLLSPLKLGISVLLALLLLLSTFKFLLSLLLARLALLRLLLF